MLIGAAKLADRNARPTRAGLKGLAPRPPKARLPTPVATAAPRAAIHMGNLGGNVSARSKPVRAAEPSQSNSGRFSHPQAEGFRGHGAGDACGDDSEGGEAEKVDGDTRRGKSEAITVNIAVCVEIGAWMCGPGRARGKPRDQPRRVGSTSIWASHAPLFPWAFLTISRFPIRISCVSGSSAGQV